MTEKTTSDAQGEGNTRQFAIQKIYIKDLSFESPAAPKVFTEKFEPEVNLNITSNTKSVSDALYEVILSVTVTVRQGERSIYLAEVHQAGIFAAQGFPDEERGQLLGSYCPNVLFPYAREVISDVVTKGGFPQLLLAPVNFDALYAQHLQQKAQGSQATH